MKKLLSILSISGIVILASCYGGKAQTTTTTTTTSEVTPTTTAEPATTTTTSSTTTAEPTTSNTEPVANTSTDPVATTTEPVTTTTEPVVNTTTEPVTTTTDVTTTTTQAETIDYANELFISEFYNINFKEHVYTVAGTNNNKAIELYNPSNETIDLSKYTVKWFSNGSTEEKGHMDLEGSLAPKTCYTLVNKYATDFLKINGDVEGEVYIGPKSAVGLYKNGQLIDVFGTIGASYDSNDEFVINGEEAATDVHNVKRNDEARGSVTFVDTDWTVARDGDGSTLGIHEDDQTNNSTYKATSEQITFFNDFVDNLVTDFDNNHPYTGDKLDLLYEYEGYKFEYNFAVNGVPVVSADGTINKEYIKNTSYDGYYTIMITVIMRDSEGNLLYKSDDNNYEYGYVLVYVE